VREAPLSGVVSSLTRSSDADEDLTDRLGQTKAWVLGRVDGDAQIRDLVVIAEDLHVGARKVVRGDEIVRGEARRPLQPARAAVSATAAMRFGRQVL